MALDLFPTDTTELADYVLPAASFLEFDDLIAAYFNLTLSAQVKVMPPLGQALPKSRDLPPPGAEPWVTREPPIYQESNRGS